MYELSTIKRQNENKYSLIYIILNEFVTMRAQSGLDGRR